MVSTCATGHFCLSGLVSQNFVESSADSIDRGPIISILLDECPLVKDRWSGVFPRSVFFTIPFPDVIGSTILWDDLNVASIATESVDMRVYALVSYRLSGLPLSEAWSLLIVPSSMFPQAT